MLRDPRALPAITSGISATHGGSPDIAKHHVASSCRHDCFCGARHGLAKDDPAAPSVVANLAGVGWFQVDTGRTITAVSPELERITGFTASEVLGKPCISLIRCRECLRGCGVFRHGRVDDAKLSVFRKDGTEIDVVRSGEVTHDASGHVIGAVETVRLLDQGSPARSFEQVETLLGSLGRMFIVADAGHRVMSASASLAESLGVAPEDLIGLPLTRIFGEALFGNGGS
jgi:PAS domain S-box-containing protein